MSISINLPPDTEAAVRARARAAGLSAEEYVLQALDQAVTLQTGRAAEEIPIWEAIVDNMKDVPGEEMEALPHDSASQVDHYLYGRRPR